MEPVSPSSSIFEPHFLGYTSDLELDEPNVYENAKKKNAKPSKLSLHTYRIIGESLFEKTANFIDLKLAAEEYYSQKKEYMENPYNKLRNYSYEQPHIFRAIAFPHQKESEILALWTDWYPDYGSMGVNELYVQYLTSRYFQIATELFRDLKSNKSIAEARKPRLRNQPSLHELTDQDFATALGLTPSKAAEVMGFVKQVKARTGGFNKPTVCVAGRALYDVFQFERMVIEELVQRAY